MDPEIQFLRDQVLSHDQHGHNPQASTPIEVGAQAQAATSLATEQSIIAPLVVEYERQIEEMTEQLHKYQAQMAEVKFKMDRVIKENESLHTELRESVEKKLHAMPVSSNVEGGPQDEETIIKNLKEQLQLSEQERRQAMELWQTTSQELDRLVPFLQHTQTLQVANQKLEMTNQQIFMILEKQTAEMAELQSQHQQSKAELRTATAKANELTKLLHDLREQTQRWEEDVAKAQGREKVSDQRLRQLQSVLGQQDSRLSAATQEADAVRREKSVYEKKVGELQTLCTTLEQEKFDALTKVRERDQAAEEALLREKQVAVELEKTKQFVKRLSQDAATSTRNEVENVCKKCNIQILRLNEEMSVLQLECAEKQSQIERCLRERKTVEEELEKVNKESTALHQSCLEAERKREDINITLQSTKNKLKKMEMDHSEALLRCQEEVQRLQKSLATTREESVSISEERLKLQQENTQLCKDMADLRKSNAIDQKKAKQRMSQLEQEYCLKEKELDAQIRELEDSGRRHSADQTRLLAAQQKTTQHWKEEAKKLSQEFESKMMSHKSELNRQKQHSRELKEQLETDRAAITEHERQLAEYREKSSRLQTRLAQAEQKAAAATQQLHMIHSRQKRHEADTSSHSSTHCRTQTHDMQQNMVDRQVEEEKQTLLKDKRKRIVEFRETLQKQEQEEEKLLKARSEERLAALRQSLRRKRKREEATLIKESEKALAELKGSLRASEEEQEEKLKRQSNAMLDQVRFGLELSKEKKIKKLKAEKYEELKQLRTEFESEIASERQKLWNDKQQKHSSRFTFPICSRNPR